MQTYMGYDVHAPTGTYKGHRTLGELRESAIRDHPELDGSEVRKTVRKLERNTLEITLPNGSRIIRLHDTDVLTFHKDGRITLNTGGWQTVTSKARLNTYLPGRWSIYSDRGWFVKTPGEAERLPYFDGMTFNPDGSLTPGSRKRVWSASARREADKKLIARGMKALKNGIPHDPRGDPWVMADSRGLYEPEMVREWLREGYLTQTLVMRALEWGNVGTPQGRAYILQGIVRGDMSGWLNTVRRFLKACLSVGA